MKKQIMYHTNGLTYRKVRNLPMTKEEKRNLAMDVIDFKRAWNLKKLNQLNK